MSERIKALGQYEVYKREFLQLGIKAGSILESLRDKTNSILSEDFLDLDLGSAKVLLDELLKIQSRAKVVESKMVQIKSNYGIDDET